MSTTFRTRACAAGAATVAVAALALAAPTAAVAHVTVDGSSTTPGSTATLAFTIEHGCDGSPTTAVTIGVPDEIGGVTPIANAGWDVTFDLEGSGRTMTYTAQTPLPSAVHDTLELDVTLPDDVADGTVLAFPAEQTCEVGSESWTSLDADAEAPAPTLIVAAPVVEEASVAPPASTSPLTIAALVAALAASALATIALRRQQTKGGQR